MSKLNENVSLDTQGRLTCCYVVTCYQNIVGVYASQDDAAQSQRELIMKNRPADVLCRPIIYALS